MWSSHLNHKKYTFENHYMMINLKQGMRHWKSDMEWNLFTHHVSLHGETVSYLKSLISVCEATVVILKIGSSFTIYDECLLDHWPPIDFELYIYTGMKGISLNNSGECDLILKGEVSIQCSTWITIADICSYSSVSLICS